MSITPEVFEPILISLVGDEVQVDHFQAILTDRIREGVAEDPYEALLSGALLQIDDAIYASGANTATRQEIRQNELFAMRLVSGVLRGVDDIYTRQAREPQAVSNVTHNTNRALQHLRTMAYDGKVSYANEAAYFHGSNPRNPILQVVAKHKLARDLSKEGRARMHPRTFVVTEDEEGQLALHRRYKMIRPDGMDRCPMVDAKVGVSDTLRPGLWVMMEAMGSVAVTEIFSQHFQIVDDTKSSSHEVPLVAA